MTVRNELDRRPGSVPDIRADGDSLTFRLAVHGTRVETLLILRCDRSGDVWAAIHTPLTVRRR